MNAPRCGFADSILILFHVCIALYHNLGFKAPFVFCVIMAAIDFVMRLLIVERRNNPKEWFDPVDKRDVLSKTEQSLADSASPVLTDDATATPPTANKVSIIKLMSYLRMWGALLITFIMALVIGSIEVRNPSLSRHAQYGMHPIH
jgi:hypothetical protein